MLHNQLVNGLILPTEMLSMIFSFGAIRWSIKRPFPEQDLSLLTASLQVCKYWHITAIPLLHRIIAITDGRQARLLLRSLPSYAMHVRSLDFVSSYMESPPILIGSMVERLPQLKKLHIPAYVAPMLVDVPSFRSLTHLSLTKSVLWRIQLSSRHLPRYLKNIEIYQPARGEPSERNLPSGLVRNASSLTSDTDDEPRNSSGPSNRLRRIQFLTLSYLRHSSDNILPQLFDAAQPLLLKRLVLSGVLVDLQAEIQKLLSRLTNTLVELYIYGGTHLESLTFGMLHLLSLTKLRSFKCHNVIDLSEASYAIFDSLQVGCNGALSSWDARIALPGNLEELEILWDANQIRTILSLIRLFRNPFLLPHLKKNTSSLC